MHPQLFPTGVTRSSYSSLTLRPSKESLLNIKTYWRHFWHNLCRWNLPIFRSTQRIYKSVSSLTVPLQRLTHNTAFRFKPGLSATSIISNPYCRYRLPVFSFLYIESDVATVLAKNLDTYRWIPKWEEITVIATELLWGF